MIIFTKVMLQTILNISLWKVSHKFYLKINWGFKKENKAKKGNNRLTNEILAIFAVL